MTKPLSPTSAVGRSPLQAPRSLLTSPEQSTSSARLSTLASRPSTEPRIPAFSSSAISHQSSAIRRPAAFTLIELLVVIAVIAILAGLVMAAMGGVQKRSARARAEAEVAALSRAIIDYHRDRLEYPKADPAFLYAELTTDDSDEAGSQNKTTIYFEPTVGIVGTNANKKCFVDPWGIPYIYETNQQTIQNRGFFDIYTKAGPSTNTNAWIRN